MTKRIIIGIVIVLIVLGGIMAAVYFTENKDDMGPAEPFVKRAELKSGDVFQGESYKSLYYMGADGKRYVFTDDKTYDTWYDSFDNVIRVSDTQVGEIAIGGNVTYRPGVKLVKIPSDPTVYAVSKNGMLRPFEDTEVLIAIYGEDWESKLDDIPETLFFAYRMGPPIESAEQYDPQEEMGRSPDINTDKGLRAVDTEEEHAPLPAD